MYQLRSPLLSRWRRGAAVSDSKPVRREFDERGLEELDSTALLFGLGVIGWQSAEVSLNYDRWLGSPLWLIPQLLWGGLFALAGHRLVSSRWRDGTKLHLQRALLTAGVPLLLVVLATAALLGPMMSDRGVTNYAADAQSFTYLLNLVAIPQLGLPDVFAFNPYADIVNPTLAMVACAYLLAGAALTARGSTRRSQMAVAALSLMLIAADFAQMLGPWSPERLSIVPAASLAAGLMGLVVERQWLRWRRSLVALSLIGALLALLASGRWATGSVPLQPLAAALIGGGLALVLASRRSSPSRLADAAAPLLIPALLSSFPIQQIVATTRIGSESELSNLLLALPLIALVAASLALATHAAGRRVLGSAHWPPLPEPAAPDWRRLRHRVSALPWHRLPTIIFLLFGLLVSLAVAIFAISRPVLEN